MRNIWYFVVAVLAAMIFGVAIVLLNEYMRVIMEVFPRWQLITMMLCVGLLVMYGIIIWIVYEEKKWDRDRRFFSD